MTRKCEACEGSGDCPVCKGWQSVETGMDCDICEGSGECPDCDGEIVDDVYDVGYDIQRIEWDANARLGRK